MPTSLPQQFDVFAQLVATGSIEECARALNLGTAKVVETMNILEDRLGFQLFTVRDGGVELTDSGCKMVQALGELSANPSKPWPELLPEGAETEYEMTAARAQPEGTVSAATLPEEPGRPWDFGTAQPVEETGTATVSRPSTFHPQPPEESPPDGERVKQLVLASHPSIFSHFQEALVAFEQASPDIAISLRLESIDEADTARLFDAGLADIAYYYALGEPRHFTSRYAWSERISLFMSKDHPIAQKDVVLAEDIAHLPYVSLARGNSARVLAEAALAESGIMPGPPVLEADDLYDIMKYVESHTAWFAAFGPLARDFGRMSGIVRIAYAQSLPQIQVRQTVRKDRIDDPAVLALSEFLFR